MIFAKLDKEIQKKVLCDWIDVDFFDGNFEFADNNKYMMRDCSDFCKCGNSKDYAYEDFCEDCLAKEYIEKHTYPAE